MAHRRLVVRFVLVAVLGLTLAGLVMVMATGRYPGAPNEPPPEVGVGVRCVFNRPIAAAGSPGDDAAQQLARRMRRYCDAMNGTPPPQPPLGGLVNAREVCLDMRARGQLPGDDCSRVPADQTYSHH